MRAPPSKSLMTQGPVGRVLVNRTLPMVMGILGMVGFNLMDTFFVAQLGVAPLAALTFTFPLVLVMTGLSLGLGQGASALISKAIGAGDREEVQRLTTHALILALLLVGLFILLGLLTIDPLFSAMGANQETLPLVREYMLIWYPSILFLIIPMVGNAAIRATGDMKTPSMLMLAAMLVNFILDPLLIFGLGPFPRWELAGAAIATAIARGISLLVSLWVLGLREKMITTERLRLDRLLDSWKRILHIGLPTAGTNLILPVGIGVITGLVASYGPTAVAALGVGSRIDMFAMALVMALSSVLSPFIGQNLGAGRLERVEEGVRLSHLFALTWGTLVYLLLLPSAGWIAGLFNADPQVIEAARLYLHIIPLGYGLQGVLMLTGASLNVFSKPLESSLLTLTNIFVLAIPLSFLGSWLVGLKGIFWAGAASRILSGLLASYRMRRVLQTQRQGWPTSQNPAETA